MRWIMKLIAELKLWIDCAAPSPPVFVSLSKGDSVTMIKFIVTVPPGAQSDIVKTRVTSQVDGQPATLHDLDGNGGSLDLVVPEGSSGVVLAQYIDKAGNESKKSPEARWENASDQTPPEAPAGAPQLSLGESAPDPETPEG